MRVSDEKVHYTWSARHPVIAEVADGTVLEVVTRDGFDGQFADVGIDDLQREWGPFDFSRVAPLTGPIAVEGVAAGDILRVDILGLDPAGTGHTVIWPAWADFDFFRPEGVGAAGRLLSFDGEQLAGKSVRLGPVDVPLEPMMGMVGVAPARGEFPTLPPRHFGGNMDCKLVGAGSSVLLRAEVDGGLVSFGDGHATQGDGELCTTAIECPMRLRARVSRERRQDLVVVEPRVHMPGRVAFTSSATSLEAAARSAVGYAHEYLVRERGMGPDEAYAALSLIGDLRVNQVVNTPRPGVRLEVPEPLA